MDAFRAALSPAGALVPVEAVRRARRLPGRAALLRLANDRLRRSPRRFALAATEAGVVVDGDTSDLIERYLYVFGTWEPALSSFVSSTLRRGDVFVDIGANVGWFTMLAARAVGPEGRVVAFEPMPATLAKLRRNVAANGLANVDIVACVASDATGDVELFAGPATNRGRSSTVPLDGTPATTTAPSVIAADAIPPALWPRVRAIKIDVEGDERRVLRGLHAVLRALPVGAVVVAEVAPERLVARGESAEELVGSMTALGFAAATLPNDYHPSSYARRRTAAPVALLGTPRGIVDVVFTKAGRTR